VSPQLQGFSQWLLKRGRSPVTANDYADEVRRCQGRRTITTRLVDRELAPNSRRLTLAALRAWAKYRKDDKLLMKLEDVKLPPPQRITEKLPLGILDWRALLDATEQARLDPFVKSSLQLIQRRGFRVGAIAGLERRRAQAALDDGILVFETKQRTLRYGITTVQRQLEVMVYDKRRWKIAADIISPTSRAANRTTAARKKLWRLMRIMAEKAGMDPAKMHPHRLRRTYATMFLKQLEGDPEALVKLKDHMQWSDINTAARYVDHSRREELDAVAVGLLGDL